VTKGVGKVLNIKTEWMLWDGEKNTRPQGWSFSSKDLGFQNWSKEPVGGWETISRLKRSSGGGIWTKKRRKAEKQRGTTASEMGRKGGGELEWLGIAIQKDMQNTEGQTVALGKEITRNKKKEGEKVNTRKQTASHHLGGSLPRKGLRKTQPCQEKRRSY